MNYFTYVIYCITNLGCKIIEKFDAIVKVRENGVIK